MLELWGLFTAAFLAATLLPGGSELVLAALANRGQHDPWLLLAVATLGNTLGGMSSWLLGWWLGRRYPAAEGLAPARQRAVTRVRRWGAPALLLAWVPLLGDPLCVAAGWLRVSWAWAALFIGVGKAARYAVVLGLASP